MKSLALLVFVYLVVPGSGQLMWDGLPLSTRAEFATLIVLMLSCFNRKLRDSIRHRISRASWSGVLKPALGLLILIKLLTFTWYPFSDGFDTCYRSVYNPLENPSACEKSYEGPFLRRSDIGLSNTSRIERTIDFGTHTHDWSLPFMNEYPRLGALWLYRFPFSAQFGAMLENDTSTSKYFPIWGNGEIGGTLDSKTFSNEGIALTDRYEFPRVIVVELPSGRSEFMLHYRYSDDDAIQMPDEAPPIRGPYGMLKVGRPQSREELLGFLQIRVRGWAVDVARNETPDFVFARDDSGREIGRSEPQSRPDVANFIGIKQLDLSGFNFAVPANVLEQSTVTVEAAFGDRRVTLGKLSRTATLVPSLPRVESGAAAGTKSEFSIWFDASREDFTAMEPNARFNMPLVLRLLLLLVDFLSAVMFGGLVFGVLRVWHRELLIAVGLALVTFGLVTLGSQYAPTMLGTRLYFPLGVLSLVVVFVARYAKSLSTFTYLPMAVVLAAYKSFDQLERFHGSKGERWWGRLLYYWRDSDWFATQGYARTVFLEGSLRGGEAAFWFQAGPRYLALLTRTLLGENDVLVGILMTTLGFFAVFTVYVTCRRFLTTTPLEVSGGVMLFVLLFFMADDLMAGFGFVGSSEYPTWIALLFITGFIVATRGESRPWLMIGMSIALGYSIQLRPNQIGGVVLLFVALLLLIDRTDRVQAITTAGKMIVAFAVVVSFSLLHNLYYGESFVLFTANAGINYAFSWRDVLGIDAGDADWSVVWDQARFMMYWNAIGNYSWAFMFWGSQLCWLGVVAYRLRHRLVLRARSLYLLIPFGYAVPMLKYQMTSYYPRHLVAINLSFLCAALMAWPRKEEAASSNDEPAAAGGDGLAARRDVAAAAAALDRMVSGVNP